MRATDSAIPKSLWEVWEWKEAVYKHIKDKTVEQKKAYFRNGLELAAKTLGTRLVENPDGSWPFV